jgi:penicillin-binding protein 2
LGAASVAMGQAPATPNSGDPRIKPTWETQKQARTYSLSIPAPRGQITDRNGSPLAQSRVGWNLGLAFPPGTELNDEQLIAYAAERIRAAERVLGRTLGTSREPLIRHYRNRSVLPYELAADLVPEERAKFERSPVDGLVLRAAYYRFYPNGSLAGHVLGYCGRTGKTDDGPLENGDSLWPDFEGRDGLEAAFNQQLTGQPGLLNVTLDAAGRKSSEIVAIPPQPGHNVITTIDEDLQRFAEGLLEKNLQRGAFVVIDPRTGELLVLASWPSYNPNLFVPSISAAEFKKLQDDTDIPLLPRAFRSAYPPGSVFKCVTGVAALEAGRISTADELECPPSWSIGKLVFRNWKKEHAGSLNFTDALTQSCNTWFYQVAVKTGARAIVDWAGRFGFGMKTGIPLAAEAVGRVPDDAYMRKNYARPMLDGDVANIGIGQGDLLVTPLQMAQMMATISEQGLFLQTRLVRQVQSLDGRIVAAYEARLRDKLELSKATITALDTGLEQVVSGGMGTASQAAVPKIKVAGKTGTAQWGPKNKEKTAAWFAGFAPADDPRYAFAVLYEGNPNDDDIHGGSHAAPIVGKFLKEAFKREREAAEKDKPKDAADAAGEKSTGKKKKKEADEAAE